MLSAPALISTITYICAFCAQTYTPSILILPVHMIELISVHLFLLCVLFGS